MKRMHPLVLAITTGLVFLALNPAALAQDSGKKKTYTERAAAETLNPDGSKKKKTTEAAPLYPLATRIEPKQEGDSSQMKLRNKMIIAFQKEKDAEALQAAEELKANPKSNDNDRSVALQVMTILASKKDKNDNAKIIPLLEENLQLNSMDNNAHYGSMYELAQRYLLNQDYEDGLEKARQFMAETKTKPKEILIVEGNALYRLGKLPESIKVLEEVHAMDSANLAITQMLAKAYSDTGQPQKAAELTKSLVAVSGNDKGTRVNLAITYRDAKQFDQAADVIAQLRAEHQMTEERDYLVAINVYSAMKNREKDLAEVIQEGLDKGALKPTQNIYSKLAEAYYYSGEEKGVSKAMAAWQKAAPMSKDGTAFLNLGIVQCQEDLWAQCKESAKAALAKGGIKPGEAWTLISNAEYGLGNSAAGAEAKRKAGNK